MMESLGAAPVLVAFAVAFAVTWATLHFLPRVGVVDVPNERSSHDRPTPTLGGLGLIGGAVAGVLTASRVGVGFESLPENAFIGAAVLMVLFGRDEIRPMGRMMKLLVQCAAAILLIGHGVVLERISLPGTDAVSLGAAGVGVTFLWLVASQNIHNFMDGIDGLVGLYGVVAAAGLAWLFADALPDAALMCTLVGAASAGFLLLNLPPARIFLGDVGSHFLGLFLAVMAVVGERAGISFWLSGMVMAAFLFDGGYTIVRRFLMKENVTVAHRFHLYQRLVRMGASHGLVTLLYAASTALLAALSVTLLGHPGWAPWALIPTAAGFAIATVAIERAWKRSGAPG